MKIFTSLAAILFMAVPAFAQVTVNGSGNAFAPHDAAEVAVLVSTRHTSAAQANKQNRDITKTLVTMFDNRKIDKKDRQTTGFAVEPTYTYSKDNEAKLTGYRTNHSMSVTVHNLDDVGDFIDGAIEAGAFVTGIRFKVCDTTSMMRTARDAAMADARAKAEQLAKAAGATLGKVVSINESWNYPRPRSDYRLESANADRSSATQIASGEHQVTCNVTVIWELCQGSGRATLPLTPRIHQSERDDK